VSETVWRAFTYGAITSDGHYGRVSQLARSHPILMTSQIVVPKQILKKVGTVANRECSVNLFPVTCIFLSYITFPNKPFRRGYTSPEGQH
jgi:hypothetical protein